MAKDILIACESGVIEVDGEQFVISKGKTRIRANHPLAKQNPELFKSLDVNAVDIEAAVAAPGEKRK